MGVAGATAVHPHQVHFPIPETLIQAKAYTTLKLETPLMHHGSGASAKLDADVVPAIDVWCNKGSGKGEREVEGPTKRPRGSWIGFPFSDGDDIPAGCCCSGSTGDVGGDSRTLRQLRKRSLGVLEPFDSISVTDPSRTVRFTMQSSFGRGIGRGQ